MIIKDTTASSTGASRTSRLTRHHLTRALLCIALAVALAAAAAGCSSIAALWGGGTHIVTDSMGRAVELPRRINRIVSLAPANTEMLFAVGAGDKVVGVDEYSNYPAAAAKLPKVGGFLDVNVEAVVGLKPDMVVVSSMHKQPVAQLEQLGIKCFVVEPRNITQVYSSIELLGSLVGREADAKRVVDGIKATIADVARKTSTVSQRKLVFYEVWGDPLQSAGPNTYIHEIIVLAGGRNLTADTAEDYPLIGYEVVVARDPDVIVYPTYHGSVDLTAEGLSARPGWSGIKAVRNNALHGIDADLTSRGGPRIGEAVAALAKLLYPDLFR
jgi:iron complex transport system substrate-binding protein